MTILMILHHTTKTQLKGIHLNNQKLGMVMKIQQRDKYCLMKQERLILRLTKKKMQLNINLRR